MPNVPSRLISAEFACLTCGLLGSHCPTPSTGGQTRRSGTREVRQWVTWQQVPQDPAQHAFRGLLQATACLAVARGQRRVQVSVYVAASLQQQCHRHCIRHKPSSDLRATSTASELCTRMIPPVSRRLPFSEVLRGNGLVSILTASLRTMPALCCTGARAERLRLSGTSLCMRQQGRVGRCMPALASEQPLRTRLHWTVITCRQCSLCMLCNGTGRLRLQPSGVNPL